MKNTNTVNINIPQTSTPITHQQAFELLKNSNNIINVKFIKKDGSLRSMNCRRKVISHLNGGRDTTRHIECILNVFDMIKKEYRKINTNNILNMTINKIKYNIV
jgi:hypothetical protein